MTIDPILQRGRRRTYRDVPPKEWSGIFTAARGGDIAAIADLVVLHSGLVEKFARHAYRHLHPNAKRSICLDDIRQVSRIGILRAIQRYDPERGVAFSTFASRWIVGGIGRLIRNFGCTVRAAEWARQASMGAEPRIDVSAPVREAVTASLQYVNVEDIRLSTTTAEPDDRATVVRAAIVKLARRGKLTQRAVAILTCRYLAPPELEIGLTVLAEKFGVSKQRIEQIEKAAISRIRHDLRVT